MPDDEYIDVSVVVPSLYRPTELARCLASLARQRPKVFEIIVVLRPDDRESRDLCEARTASSPIRVVEVDQPGVAAALRLGVASCRAGWVSFMDDDAEPAPDWTSLLRRHLSDSSVGCVGGSVINCLGARTRSGWFERTEPVTRVGVFGRVSSHLTDQPVDHRIEDVEFLLGSNLTMRTSVARVVTLGNATGMAAGEELEWCLTARNAGLRVLYDSDLRVAHYPAPRNGAPARDDRAAYARDFAYMQSYIFVRHFSLVRAASFFAYSFLVGRKCAPGVLPWPLYALRGQVGMAEWQGAMSGRLRGLADGFRERRGGTSQ